MANTLSGIVVFVDEQRCLVGVARLPDQGPRVLRRDAGQGAQTLDGRVTAQLSGPNLSLHGERGCDNVGSNHSRMNEDLPERHAGLKSGGNGIDELRRRF